jgi:hypothetical protein
MPKINDYVDLHCERLADGLMGEPLNILSNILFFVVAYLLFKQYRTADIRAPRVKVLIYLVVAFGVGSIIFHSTARMWGALFDVLPIVMFAVLYLYLFARHVLRFHRKWAVALIAFFFIANLIFKANVIKAPDGYVSLIPSVLVMYCIALYMFATKNRSAMRFATATLVATMAASFRAVDSYLNAEDLCEMFPFGTHFLWHVLMAGYVYLTTSDIILRCKANRMDFILVRRAKLKRVAKKRAERRKKLQAKSIMTGFSDY